MSDDKDPLTIIDDKFINIIDSKIKEVFKDDGKGFNKDGVIDKLDAASILRDWYGYAKIEG